VTSGAQTLSLTEALPFLISAAVVYFLVVLPVSRALKLFERDHAATERDCPEWA
jgi:ABC-type amino acid transport system permease subunit